MCLRKDTLLYAVLEEGLCRISVPWDSTESRVLRTSAQGFTIIPLFDLRELPQSHDITSAFSVYTALFETPNEAVPFGWFNRMVYRGLMIFDTSVLPDNSLISSANLAATFYTENRSED